MHIVKRGGGEKQIITTRLSRNDKKGKETNVKGKMRPYRY